MALRWLQRNTGDTRDLEQSLIASARGGDRAAFDALMSRYEKALRAFIQRRATYAAADDILQDTWIAAWQGIKKFTGKSSFKAWLYAISVHKCVDYHRQRARAAQWETVTEQDALSDTGIDPYAASELRHTVQAILSTLPAPQRELVELYYYDELTLPEISQILNRNLNTVKYQFYRAHTLVAQELGEASATGQAPGWRKR